MKNQALNNDTDLVKSLSRGNILAFNTIFREYSKHLYYFALGYLKSEAEAEELVQEVFTRIWEKRADLKEECSLKSYMFTIAFNLIKKHFRTRVYMSGYLNTQVKKDFDMQTLDNITHDSLLQFINQLIQKLPTRRREIFIRSRFEGSNIKEIAKEMKISHKTVENQLTDAIKFLRSNITRESK